MRLSPTSALLELEKHAACGGAAPDCHYRASCALLCCLLPCVLMLAPMFVLLLVPCPQLGRPGRSVLVVKCYYVSTLSTLYLS